MGRHRSRSMSSSSSGRGVQSTKWDGSSGHRLHVSDLAAGISRREVERAFGKYGPINEVWVATNPPCFAFINFNHRSDAEKALREVDGKTVGSTRVGVTWARERTYGGRSRRGRDSTYSSYRNSGSSSRRRSRSRSRSNSRREKRRHSRSRSPDRRHHRSRSPRDRKRLHRESEERNGNDRQESKASRSRSPSRQKSPIDSRQKSPIDSKHRSQSRDSPRNTEITDSPVVASTDHYNTQNQSPMTANEE